jgi:hypothetical protein
MERREVAGAVIAQTLAANISNVSTSFSVADGSSFPTGSLNKFVISIGRGTVTEEKMLIASRSSNTFTIETRGYDGTTAAAHVQGEIVDHVLDAVVIQDMNKTVYDTEILTWMGV